MVQEEFALFCKMNERKREGQEREKRLRGKKVLAFLFVCVKLEQRQTNLKNPHTLVKFLVVLKYER